MIGRLLSRNPLVSLAATSAATVCGYLEWRRSKDSSLSIWKCDESCSSYAVADSSADRRAAAAQGGVLTDPKSHAAFITIHLAPGANVQHAVRVAASVSDIVKDVVSDPNDEDEQVLTTVGFSPRVWSIVSPSRRLSALSFPYHARHGVLGDMPATGGDLFFHVKSASDSNCFEVARLLRERIGEDNIASFDDRYSFVYKNGRDLSGFIDGTNNLVGDDERVLEALTETGGSFIITQRWVHDLSRIQKMSVLEQEESIGRTKPDSVELSPLPAHSHVSRMTCYHESGPRKGEEIRIYRQSMPYGRIGDEAGLFFIAYARSPMHFDVMLDRMTGQTSDRLNDHVMKMTSCVTGAYWYAPSKEELALLLK